MEDRVMKISGLIESLQNLRKEVGDVEIIYGAEKIVEGKRMMDYDVPDFLFINNVAIITATQTVDSLIQSQNEQGEIQKQKQIEEAKKLLDDSPNSFSV